MQTVSKTWVSGLAAVMLLVVSQLAVADGQQSVNENRSVSANEKIYIEVMSGEIKINAVSGGKFSVVGKLDEKATGYTLDSKDGFTRFEMTMPRQVNYRGNEKSNGADLRVEVPIGSTLEFKGVNSDVSLSGISGGSKISTVNGKIAAVNLSTLVQLSTVNGEIGSKDNSGQIELSSVNGEIVDVGSSGRLNYSVVNGSIEARTSAEEISVSTVNGDIKLSGNTVVKGDLIYKPRGKKNSFFGWSNNSKPTLYIAADAVVEGNIILEQEVELQIENPAMQAKVITRINDGR